MENNVFNMTTQEDINILTNKVEIATTEFGKIKSKNDIIKKNKKDFAEQIIEALLQEFPNDDKQREQKLIKGFFNKLIKSFIEQDSSDEENTLVAGYIRKRVEELAMLIYAYKYLDNDNIEKLFENYGIKLQYNPVEKYLKYLDNDNLRNTIKQLINLTIELKNQSYAIEYAINEGIYQEIPNNLKYNKDRNPVGITKNVFKKFSLLNLLKKINISKAKKKCEDMTKEANDRSNADTLATSIADTIVSK